MRPIEHLVAIHLQAGQLIDIEKATIVDVIRGNLPVGQPPGLCFEQPMEQIEAFRPVGGAVEQRYIFVEEVVKVDAVTAQRREARLVFGRAFITLFAKCP